MRKISLADQRHSEGVSLWWNAWARVYAEQAGYYQALNASTQGTDSAPFIEFMLAAILTAIDGYEEGATPQVSPQVSPQVEKLLGLLFESAEPLSSEALVALLGLRDRKSFRARYLVPALGQGLVQMTLPGTPRSRLQRYQLTASGAALANSISN